MLAWSVVNGWRMCQVERTPAWIWGLDSSLLPFILMPREYLVLAETPHSLRVGYNQSLVQATGRLYRALWDCCLCPMPSPTKGSWAEGSVLPHYIGRSTPFLDLSLDLRDNTVS